MVGWKNWSFKKRNKAILAGALLFLLVVYWVSISNTIGLYFQNKELENKLGQAQNAPFKIAQLEKQLSYWDRLAQQSADTAAHSIQNELFERVGTACNLHEVVLRSLEFAGAEEKENSTIHTYSVIMEGSFQNLLKAVHQLENELGNGILSSVTFEVEKDRYTRKSSLKAKLYIQSVQ